MTRGEPFVALDQAQARAARHLTELSEALARASGGGDRGASRGSSRGSSRAVTGVAWLRRLRQRLGGTALPLQGIYLWGGVGRGKTHLLDWFYDQLPIAAKRRQHFHHFMRGVHAELARLPRQPDPLEAVAGAIADEVRLLCVDELVVTDIADAMLLHGLLDGLFARGVTLVTTSNAPPAGLYRNGLQRARFVPAIGLLEQHTRVLELDGGADYRRREPGRAGVRGSSVPGEPELAAAFARLAGQGASGPGRLEVNGRPIPFLGRGGGVVWFDFDALCATPRAAADYIEIASAFQILLLSGVPRLGPAREAAARRFVHLIDELYDRRVGLLWSYEVPLDQLYAGGLVDFPHERLLSRLWEMRSRAGR